MATSVSRGANTLNSTYFKPMLRKAYHRKHNSPDLVSDTVKLNGEEVKNKSPAGDGGSWWIPDERTGIFYPKGNEKAMKDVPREAGKDCAVNWFSNHDNDFA